MSVQKVFFRMKNILQFCLFCVFLSVYLHLCIHDGFMFQKMGLAIYLQLYFVRKRGNNMGKNSRVRLQLEALGTFSSVVTRLNNLRILPVLGS